MMGNKDKVYTVDYHANQLIRILEQHDTCVVCPASNAFHGNEVGNWINNQCQICCDFIKLDNVYNTVCPCTKLGKDDAVKQSWLALEAKGYI